MRKIKIRFNLGRGENYMKWKVDYPIGKSNYTTQYFEPSEWQLVMVNAVVKNNIKTATKIFKGANKEVCAWILCDNIQLNSVKQTGNRIPIRKKYNTVSYNPRVTPHWVCNQIKCDGANFDTIITKNRTLFIKD